jgi:two-component system, LytTR family, response regulator
MINAILVDDELHCLETLSILLKEYCPEVQIAEQCSSAQAALAAIKKIKPSVLFLDIEMPGMNGFELLEKIDSINFSIIFTTSYNQYAIKAIRFSALDYLLKPIDCEDLVAAVNKVMRITHPPSSEQLNMLMTIIQKGAGFSKVAVPTSEGFELIQANEIVYCEADDNYTYFFLKNKSKIVACRTLKDVEEQLESFSSFIRVHHSFLVNLNEVSKYVRGEGGYLLMSTGSTVNVSRSRKEALLKLF